MAFLFLWKPPGVRNAGRAGAILAAFLVCAISMARPAAANICYTSGCTLPFNGNGHITIVNNWWGVGGSHASGSEDVWTSSGTSWGSVFNWNQGTSQYSVKTYPEAADGWDFNCSFNGSPFPLKLSGSANAYTGATGVKAWGGSYDVIWDSFYSYSATPCSSNPAAELEVYVTASFSNFNYSYQSTVDGIKFDVNINRNPSRWNIVTYVPANGYNSGFGFNMMDVSRDAARHGFLSSSMYLLDIDFGEEIYYGKSSFNVGSYYAP